MKNLTNEHDIVLHMLGATSPADWDRRREEIREANHGYPPCWDRAIIDSGIMSMVLGQFPRARS